MKKASGGDERGSVLLRTIDRVVGIPLVWLLGHLRLKKGALPGAVAHIGILETAAIGDTTLLSGAVNDLRAAFPAAHVVLFAGGSNIDVAKLLAGVDEVVRLPINNPMRAYRIMRRYQFDLFLDFGPWPRINALLTHFAKARFKAGFKTPGQYRHYVFDLAVGHSDSRHELENYRGLVRALDIQTGHPPGFPPSVGLDRPSVIQRDEQYVVFHLWPGGYRSHLKEWPLDNWLRLGSELSALGYEIVLTGAPSERQKNEKVLAEASKLRGRAWRNCAGSSIAETIGILRHSRLTVSVNTGVMHLAAVIGTPVIGLHGPTSALRWGPVGPNAIAISATGGDCGYLNLGFEYPQHCNCMSRISVEQVKAHSLQFLTQTTGAYASS